MPKYLLKLIYVCYITRYLVIILGITKQAITPFMRNNFHIKI